MTNETTQPQQASAVGESECSALLSAEEQLEWLWANCRIVYWPEFPNYPLEHAPAANKNAREFIEAEMRKGR